MNINAKKGAKVIYANPNNGYEHDQKTAAQYLTEGQEYTVESIDVMDWSSNVYLQEIQDKYPSGQRVNFNTVMFEDVKRSREDQS